jgi:hypothetical protein
MKALTAMTTRSPMKTPKDSPTKVGDRVGRRGEPGRDGTVVRINADRPAWRGVRVGRSHAGQSRKTHQ